jgi:preprotein translocase subunit SecE
MSNQSVQTVSTSNDKFKVVLAVVAAIAGVVGFFYLKGQNKPAVVAAGALVAGLVFAVLLLWTSTTGREFLNFRQRVRSRNQEGCLADRQGSKHDHHGIVFGFVVVMAMFLWGTDKLLEFLLYDLILGWKQLMSDNVENVPGDVRQMAFLTLAAAPVSVPVSNKRWYVVHVYSGMEKSVMRALTERIERAGMQRAVRPDPGPDRRSRRSARTAANRLPSVASSLAMCWSRWK